MFRKARVKSPIVRDVRASNLRRIRHWCSVPTNEQESVEKAFDSMQYVTKPMRIATAQRLLKCNLSYDQITHIIRRIPECSDEAARKLLSLSLQ